MGLTVAAIAVVTASAVLLFLSRHARTVAAPIPPTSPLDEAQRILARRYARSEITAEEYGRMLAILRR